MPLQTESRQIKQQIIIGPFLWETSLWTEPDLSVHLVSDPNTRMTRMWANAQRDGRPAEHRWRPLFNTAKFG